MNYMNYGYSELITLHNDEKNAKKRTNIRRNAQRRLEFKESDFKVNRGRYVKYSYSELITLHNDEKNSIIRGSIRKSARQQFKEFKESDFFRVISKIDKEIKKMCYTLGFSSKLSRELAKIN